MADSGLSIRRWVSTRDTPLKRVVPYRFRSGARRVLFAPVDALESLRRRDVASEIPTPPRHLDNVGGEFAWIAETFLSYFSDVGGLEPDDDVLDIGCGVGRMARGLVNYLDSEATYEGFDIVPASIRWCQKHISTRYPQFHFQVADVYNKYYHRRGRWPASQYTFPWEPDSFDFAFATSVFTHMLHDEVGRYLSEAARVLRPGGRLFATFSLVNDEVVRLAEESRGHTGLYKYRTDEAWLAGRDAPEALIAFPETWVLGRYRQAGLEVTDIRYGSWSGREESLAGQDIVVARVVN
jgi:SAM-dependent methyltransferase